MVSQRAAFACAVFALSVALSAAQQQPCHCPTAPGPPPAGSSSRSDMALSVFRDPFGGSDTPFGSLLPFPDIFSTLIDAGPVRSFVTDSQARLGTQVDVKESPDHYEFIADLPGLKPEDVKVQLEDGNVLAISGERKRETKTDDQYHRVERSVGRFLRRFRLPDNADTENIQASFQNGELHIRVPKKQKDQKKLETKDIPVQVIEGEEGKPSIEGSKKE